MTFQSDPKTNRILVVDDDRQLIAALGELLEMVGYQVELAYSGPDALGRTVERRYDLIMTDMMMPGMDGFTLLSRLKQQPATSTVPIIMMSGKADPVDQQESLRRGATDYLVKPFRLETLLQIVEKCLDDTPHAN